MQEEQIMHKKIGILGGLSPESTVAYYQYLTHTYTERYGDYGYPEILMYSVSFQTYADWTAAGRWDLISDGLVAAGRSLEAAGADFLIISANTMHMVYEDVRVTVKIPVLSLFDALAEAIHAQGFKTVGLLGTQFVMEKPFYRDELSRYGIHALSPAAYDRIYVNRVIYEELVAGQIRDESRDEFRRIIGRLQERGVEGIILGCTEIPLLIGPDDVELPLFNTMALHAEAALKYACGE
jgi:aspartate racemase